MSLANELRRRKVPRAVGFYLAAGFGAVEILAFLAESLRPEWADSARYGLAAAYLLGLPIAVYLSWAYDWEGGELRPTPPETAVGKRALAGFGATLAILAAVLAGLILWPRQPAHRPQDDTRDAPANSIAVLPFSNMSADQENAEFLAAGLHDDLLTLLSKIGGLRVISRTSVARYRETDKGLRQIGAELGVSKIMEGGVQRAGNRVRINVQLIDAATDEHLWADRYDREITAENLFGIQNEIAVAIASAMETELSARDRTTLGNVPTDNLEAYQAYLIGKQRMITRSSDSLGAALEYFDKAIMLDPDFAPAYVGLADTYMLLGDYGNLARAEMTAKATAAAEKALSLDGQLASAYTSLGAIRSKNRDFTGAEAAFQKAIEIDRNQATAFHWYADVLLNNRRQPEAALPKLLRALELDPLSPAINATLGQIYEALGRFDDARFQYEKTIEIEPAYSSSYFLIGSMEHFAHGRVDEAVRWYREAAARDPGNLVAQSWLGIAYLDLGDVDQARFWIDRVMFLGPTHYWPSVAMTFLRVKTDDERAALAAARRLAEIAPADNLPLAVLVAYGEYREALRWSADQYPELTCSQNPEVHRANLFPALNLSLAWQQDDDQACAGRLLEKALAVMAGMPRLGSWGYGIADVEARARLGQTELALTALRNAVDGGWRAFWWAQGERSPHLVALREDPRFEAMMDEIRADMGAQRDRVREMERIGQLAPIPSNPGISPDQSGTDH
ncbi:MAG: tetratricopeptide repeat protein [Gammaproteobacteria bacterium]